MKKNPYYRLKRINGVPYLLAFGQGNADFCLDISLNETGAFLWEQIDYADTPKELVELCKRHYEPTDEEYPSMAKAVSNFITDLYFRGALLPENTPKQNEAAHKTLQIAGLYLKIFGPEEMLSSDILSFEADTFPMDDAPIYKVHICSDKPPHFETGKLLLHNKSLSVAECDDRFVCFFPAFNYVEAVHIYKDDLSLWIYLAKGLSSSQKENAILQEEISYALRTYFFYLAQTRNMLAVHSSSILYKDKIWLFSAPAGTGKSTHANLWHKVLDVPVINGDLNLIDTKGDVPTVRGIPWCGTSGIYDKKTYPLGGIILLAQGPDNVVSNLSKDQKALRLLHRALSPSWTKTLQNDNLRMIESIEKNIFICHYACTKNMNSVTVLQNAIDETFQCC